MIIRNSKQKIDDKELFDFETRLKIKFPNDYKGFLLRNNGGGPVPNVFDFVDNNGQNANSLVHYFYAVYDGKEYDNLEYNYLFFIGERRIPTNILPIAGDPFGNMICISVSGDDIGKVYFWDHELESQSESYDNLSLVSTSFTEFLDSLYEQKY